MEEESNTQECLHEESQDSTVVKSLRNGRVLNLDADIMQLDAMTKNKGTIMIANLASVTLFKIILVSIY